MKKLIVEKDDANQTIFNYIKKRFKTTTLSVIYKLFRNKKIRVNKKVVKDRKYILQENDVIEIYDNNIEITNRLTETKFDNNIKLNVIYEDDNILIVDKPFNLEIHSNYNISLDYIVREYLKEKMSINNNSFVVSHVHRLDKWTRGLVIYAKNKIALDSLLNVINDKEYIEKYYYAICQNSVNLKSSLISGYIYKDEAMQKMIFTPKLSESNPYKKEAKNCATEFKLIKNIKHITILEAKLITGRKHQIRATLAYLKSPVLNDVKYGAKQIFKENKLGLIAYKITFNNFKGNLEYLNNKIIKLSEKVLEEFII